MYTNTIDSEIFLYNHFVCVCLCASKSHNYEVKQSNNLNNKKNNPTIIYNFLKK